MILSRSKAFLAPTLVMLLASCSVNSSNDGVALNLNGEASVVKDKRFQLSSVLNHSPQVVIAKPKEHEVVEKQKSFGLHSLFGGMQEKSGDEFKTDKSLARGAEANSEAGINGSPLSNFKHRESPVHNSSGSFTKSENEDISFPVVSIAYGGETTVVKSVDGGFATLLLRENNRKNSHACNALFTMMNEMTNKEIEQAAENNENLSRPTYWLDKRKAPPEKRVKRSRSASIKGYVHLASAKAGSPSKAQKGLRARSKRPANCKEKLRHYHFKASHSLIKRLGLSDRLGPFLVAWRDDGKKAMIVDLSQLESELDFKMAMFLWVGRIVQRPGVWEEGEIASDSFRQEMNALLKKSGKFSMFVRKPLKETIAIN